MAPPHAVVVGGGIGGLCAAIGLRHIGWPVTVLERSPAFTGVGAGITLWPNALRALHALGLSGEVEPLLTPQAPGRVRDHRGRWLTEWDGDRIERALGGPMVGIHRADLLKLLRGALPDGTLQLASEVTDVTPDGTVAIDGTRLTADVVVGADGINSTIRQTLWPDHAGPAYVGATAFRAVTDVPDTRDIFGIVGPGSEVGMVPLAGRRLYWYVTFNAEQGAVHTDAKRYLLERFAGWPDPLPEVVAQTPAEAVLHHDLYALRIPLESYVAGRVVLLGDAAHAMPPYLGQGGCQAIEDAVELAAALAPTGAVSSALHRYDQSRRGRSQAIAKQSWRAARLGAQLSNPLAVAARNRLLRVLPDSIGIRQLVQSTRWHPPHLPKGLGHRLG